MAPGITALLSQQTRVRSSMCRLWDCHAATTFRLWSIRARRRRCKCKPFKLIAIRQAKVIKRIRSVGKCSVATTQLMGRREICCRRLMRICKPQVTRNSQSQSSMEAQPLHLRRTTQMCCKLTRATWGCNKTSNKICGQRKPSPFVNRSCPTCISPRWTKSPIQQKKAHLVGQTARVCCLRPAFRISIPVSCHLSVWLRLITRRSRDTIVRRTRLTVKLASIMGFPQKIRLLTQPWLMLAV